MHYLATLSPIAAKVLLYLHFSGKQAASLTELQVACGLSRHSVIRARQELASAFPALPQCIECTSGGASHAPAGANAALPSAAHALPSANAAPAQVSNEAIIFSQSLEGRGALLDRNGEWGAMPALLLEAWVALGLKARGTGSTVPTAKDLRIWLERFGGCQATISVLQQVANMPGIQYPLAYIRKKAASIKPPERTDESTDEPPENWDDQLAWAEQVAAKEAARIVEKWARRGL